ncbi:MAG: helix-hairpin-helix domain-containing protein, partial [bacterium]
MQSPGVGKSVAQDLIDLGINSIPELEKENPEILYNDLISLKG